MLTCLTRHAVEKKLTDGSVVRVEVLACHKLRHQRAFADFLAAQHQNPVKFRNSIKLLTGRYCVARVRLNELEVNKCVNTQKLE